MLNFAAERYKVLLIFDQNSFLRWVKFYLCWIWMPTLPNETCWVPQNSVTVIVWCALSKNEIHGSCFLWRRLLQETPTKNDSMFFIPKLLNILKICLFTRIVIRRIIEYKYQILEKRGVQIPWQEWSSDFKTCCCTKNHSL